MDCDFEMVSVSLLFLHVHQSFLNVPLSMDIALGVGYADRHVLRAVGFVLPQFLAWFCFLFSGFS